MSFLPSRHYPRHAKGYGTPSLPIPSKARQALTPGRAFPVPRSGPKQTPSPAVNGSPSYRGLTTRQPRWLRPRTGKAPSGLYRKKVTVTRAGDKITSYEVKEVAGPLARDRVGTPFGRNRTAGMARNKRSSFGRASPLTKDRSAGHLASRPEAAQPQSESGVRVVACDCAGCKRGARGRSSVWHAVYSSEAGASYRFRPEALDFASGEVIVPAPRRTPPRRSLVPLWHTFLDGTYIRLQNGGDLHGSAPPRAKADNIGLVGIEPNPGPTYGPSIGAFEAPFFAPGGLCPLNSTHASVSRIEIPDSPKMVRALRLSTVFLLCFLSLFSFAVIIPVAFELRYVQGLSLITVCVVFDHFFFSADFSPSPRRPMLGIRESRASRKMRCFRRRTLASIPGFCYLALYPTAVHGVLAWHCGSYPSLATLPPSSVRFGVLCGRHIVPRQTGALLSSWQAARPYACYGALPSGLGSLVDPSGRNRDKDTVGKAEFVGSPVPGLNNAAPVPNEYLFGKVLQENDPVVGPHLVPSELAQVAPNIWRAQEGGATVRYGYARMSEFFRHFPENSARMVESFESTPRIYALEVVRPDDPARDDVIDRFAYRAPLPAPEEFRAFGKTPSPLDALYRAGIDPEALRAAESVLSTARFFGPRGNRQLQGWESQVNERARAFCLYADRESRGQRYFTFFYRLWSSYYAKALELEMGNNLGGDAGTWGPSVQAAFVDPANIDTTNPVHLPSHITVHAMTARMAPGAVQAGNGPEWDLWDPAAGALDKIAEGQAAFIDAEGLTDRELGLVIRHMAPAVCDFSRVFTHTAAPNAVFRNPLSAVYSEGARFTESRTGNTEFFIHWGTRAISPQDAYLGYSPQGHANFGRDTPWNQDYSMGEIASVMRHFAVHHHAWSDMQAAYDAVTYRVFGIVPSQSPNAAGNAPSSIFPAFGDRALHLPSNYTLPAYLDAFRFPMPADIYGKEMSEVLTLRPRELLWVANLATLAHGASITWAALANSLEGRIFNAAQNIRGAANDYTRNHAQAYFYRRSPQSINAWANAHGMATRIMYGFRPSASTLLTTSMWMEPNLTFGQKAPFFFNPYHDMWALKVIPRVNMLPLPNGAPSWPAAENRPVISASEVRDIRCARDGDAFTGRAYVQDGGQFANFQYYAAVGNGEGEFRFENYDSHAQITVGQWDTPFQHNHPTNAVYFGITSLGGVGSPFADFVCPGSISTFNPVRNRIQAIGPRLVTGAANPDARKQKRAWFELASQRTFQSLAVTYRHPLGFTFDDEPRHDYSIIWHYTAAGDYDHTTLVDHAALVNSLPPPGMSQLADYANYVPSGTFPAHLANAEPPALTGAPAHPYPKVAGSRTVRRAVTQASNSRGKRNPRPEAKSVLDLASQNQEIALVKAAAAQAVEEYRQQQLILRQEAAPLVTPPPNPFPPPPASQTGPPRTTPPKVQFSDRKGKGPVQANVVPKNPVSQQQLPPVVGQVTSNPVAPGKVAVTVSRTVPAPQPVELRPSDADVLSEAIRTGAQPDLSLDWSAASTFPGAWMANAVPQEPGPSRQPVFASRNKKNQVSSVPSLQVNDDAAAEAQAEYFDASESFGDTPAVPDPDSKGASQSAPDTRKINSSFR